VQQSAVAAFCVLLLMQHSVVAVEYVLRLVK